MRKKEEIKMAIDTTKNPLPFEMAQIPGPEMAPYMPKVDC